MINIHCISTLIQENNVGKKIIRNSSLLLFRHIIKPEYNFFKPGQIVCWKLCYIGQGEFHTKHQTKYFSEND